VILAMFALWEKKSVRKNIREMGPALAILLATLVISAFITEFTFSFGTEALWKALFRFLRLSLLLTLPLLLLSTLCTLLEGIFNRGTRHLIQLQEDRDPAIHPLKNWVIRPFQGIGLAMLLATKPLSILEIYTGSRITVQSVLPPGGVHPRAFLQFHRPSSAE
jgi:hypothetical protein